jgi:hypothetical protein
VYVSTIDGRQWTYNGTTYVAAPVSADWTTTGNSGTVQATNFIGTRDNTGLSFRTNNQIRQTIDNTGNVGIGVTVPLSRVSIAGGNNEIGFYQGGLNQGKQAIIKVASPADGDGHLAFETYQGGFGGGERMRITRNGFVGIGTTTPTNRLHVPNSGFNPTGNDLASIKVEGSYGGGIAFAEGANRSLIWSDSGRSLNFSTGGTVAGTPERMRITFNGNVGINVTAPTQKLEVGGNIRVTGVPNYPTITAAISDTALINGTMYTVTTVGGKQLFIR